MSVVSDFQRTVSCTVSCFFELMYIEYIDLAHCVKCVTFFLTLLLNSFVFSSVVGME